MSDDTKDDSPILIGEPVDAEDMTAQLNVTAQDMDDAVRWWDERASDLFVGVLEG